MFLQASHTYTKPIFWGGDGYRFWFNGQERDDEIAGVGNIMTAEFWEYDARLGRRLNVDPVIKKWESSFASFSNNPIFFLDPKGDDVIAKDEKSKENIKNTLTKEEAKYVKFKKDGSINTKKLNKSNSNSENMTALKALANSDVKYKFKVAEKDDDGASFYEDIENPKNFYRGVTEVPNAKKNPSPDNDVWIIVGNVLSDEQQAKTTAHEAYGHGYFYELSRKDNAVEFNHTYESKYTPYWDEELKTWGVISVMVPSNTKLEEQIEKVVKQAQLNYESRQKK